MVKKNKILIPGGTGFLGFHICNFFKKKGWIVHSVSKSKPKKNRKIIGVKYILCDVSKKTSLNKKLDYYYDYVVNVSGYVDHSKNQSIKKTHLNGCKNLINIYKDRAIKKFVQIGSCIEYGNQRSPQVENVIKKKINTLSKYGDAKLSATLFLQYLFKKKKIPITVLRLYLVYGPNQDNNRVIPFVINNCINHKKFNCSPGYQLRDFTFVSDIVDAIYKTLKSKNTDGQVINIGCGKPTRIRDLIKQIVKIIGSGKPVFNKLTFRKDELTKLYPNISKAKRLLKWKPKINLKKGLSNTIKFHLN